MLDPQILIAGVLNGLLAGGIYVLVAVGLTLIYGVLHIINFAHGSLLMLAMYVVFWLWRLVGLDPYVALPLVTAGAFAFGFVAAILGCLPCLPGLPRLLPLASPLAGSPDAGIAASSSSSPLSPKTPDDNFNLGSWAGFESRYQPVCGSCTMAPPLLELAAPYPYAAW